MSGMVKVSSSNIDEVGYDEASKALTVKFKNGSTYRYADVAPHHHQRMIEGDSVGGYFHKHIRNDHDSVRIG